MRRSRGSFLRAVCMVAVALSSSLWGASPPHGVSASVTDSLTNNMNDHEIYKKKWEPALPVANNTYVVEEAKLTVLGRHIQYLKPGEQFVVLIANTSAITLLPDNYRSMAYDVENGKCDRTSAESYVDIFDRAPAGYQFWKVEQHKGKAVAGQDESHSATPSPRPGVTLPGAQGSDSGAGPQKGRLDQRKSSDGDDVAVTSLLFTAPSKNEVDDGDEEFCIVAQETDGKTQRSVSLIVVVNSTSRMFMISGLAVTTTSIVALLRSLSFL